MSRYAATTEVSSERSRVEIERTIRRYGAKGFMYGFDDDRAAVSFKLHDRLIRFILVMPDFHSREFTHTPSKGLRRTQAGHEEAYEQAVKQRWRALHLVIKAKLEAVESGIVTFDQEFLSHIVLPNGLTVAEVAVPEMRRAYELNEAPASFIPALPAGANV